MYYRLTKPGIIYGNGLAAIAGFLLASGQHVDWWKGVFTVVGIAFVIASGCVYNNYLDRGIDRKMKRTKKRALALGLISGRSALIYATSLGLLGFLLLALYTNVTTIIIGVVGLADYVIFYGYTKRKSVYGTLVGSISGATPPLAGFTAVSGQLNSGGLLLFLVLLFWQMPHFYAIAMYRKEDYAAAGIPVLPIMEGNRIAKLYIVAYVFWFLIAAALLFIAGYSGFVYLVAMLALGLWWLWSGLRGFRRGVDDVKWARGMFFQSLIILLVFCVLVSASAILP